MTFHFSPDPDSAPFWASMPPLWASKTCHPRLNCEPGSSRLLTLLRIRSGSSLSLLCDPDPDPVSQNVLRIPSVVKPYGNDLLRFRFRLWKSFSSGSRLRVRFRTQTIFSAFFYYKLYKILPFLCQKQLGTSQKVGLWFFIFSGFFITLYVGSGSKIRFRIQTRFWFC